MRYVFDIVEPAPLSASNLSPHPTLQIVLIKQLLCSMTT